jgi:hypothetical protein
MPRTIAHKRRCLSLSKAFVRLDNRFCSCTYNQFMRAASLHAENEGVGSARNLALGVQPPVA